MTKKWFFNLIFEIGPKNLTSFSPDKKKKKKFRGFFLGVKICRFTAFLRTIFGLDGPKKCFFQQNDWESSPRAFWVFGIVPLGGTSHFLADPPRIWDENDEKVVF